MVETKEFAILFKKIIINEEIEEFIPIKVIEGNYNYEDKWFTDEDDIPYLHIEITPSRTVGYACRTKIELMKNSLSEESVEKIKNEIYEYSKKFTYQRDKTRNELIIATDKETGSEYLFEDLDNFEEYNDYSKESDYETNDIRDMTPLEIEEQIKKTIKGQDQAIKKIVMALWTTINFRELKKKNMLIIGPTGVGKTAIFEKVKKILNLPLVIFPVPGLSQAGYVGRSVDEILKQVYYEANGNIEEAEKAIIILDEIDKIAQKGDFNSDVSTSAVQNELLKIIEGCERYIETGNPHDPSFTIDTSDMIFIGTGAFQELFEKEKPKIGFENNPKIGEKKIIDTDRLINYGLKRELVGRLPITVELNQLGKEELKDIVMNSDESELIATVNVLKLLDIEIENLDEVIDIIVEDAITKKIGARGLIFTINNIFQEIFYEVGNNQGKYKRVIIGPNIIKDNQDFKLITKKQKTRTRKKHTVNR